MIPFNKLSFWEKQLLFNGLHTLVIGSGLVGLSTAIHVKQKFPNRKVCVLERGYLPTGASTKNAGFACIGSPSEILDDLKSESEAQVFARIDKRWRGLQYLRELLGDQQIEYESLGSHELFTEKDQTLFADCLNQQGYLNRELKRITGKEQCFQLAGEVILNSGFSGFKQAISHAAEAQINTGSMMQNLLAKASALGVQVLNGIEVQSIESNHVNCAAGQIPFEQLAVCTNALTQQFYPELDVNPARAQVIITKPIENLKMKGIFHMDQGYYYFRNVGNRVLLGGGRNLNFNAEATASLDTTGSLIQHLHELLQKNILPNQRFELEDSWAGTLGLGKSREPLVKQIHPNQYIAVRLGGMGIAIGSLLGKELAELMD